MSVPIAFHMHGSLQVQSRLLDAKGFRDTYAQLLKDQALLRSAVRNRHKEDVRGSMHRCIELCKARDARKRRLERLKRTLDHSRGFLGADPQTLLEFWDPTRHHSIASHSIGDSPAPGKAPEPTPRSVPTDISPDLTRWNLHSRNASISSLARFGRGRESSTGAAMHDVHAPPELHRDAFSLSLAVGSTSPGIAGNGGSDASVGARATVMPADEAGSGANDVLKHEDPLGSPDHTGALYIHMNPIPLILKVKDVRF
jgi:hypothetical protein